MTTILEVDPAPSAELSSAPLSKKLKVSYGTLMFKFNEHALNSSLRIEHELRL